MRTTQVAALVELEQTRETLRREARTKLGVVGQGEVPGFREACKRHGLSYYPIVALGLLFVADTFQSNAFTVLTPEISRTLGISVVALAGARAFQGMAVAVAPLPVAALSQRWENRARLCLVTGVAWSVMTLFTGFVTSLLGLVAILCLDGLTTGSVTALHAPLILDSYHPEARVRALSAYNALGTFGNVLAPALVALFTVAAALTWRGIFLALGILAMAMAAAAWRLRDPGYGHWDTQELRASVHRAHGDTRELAEEDVALGFWETCRRVLLVPTNKRVYAGFTVFGMLLVPLVTFMSVFLDQRWNMGPGARGLFFAGYALFGVVALLLYGPRAEGHFRASPSRVLRACGGIVAASVVLVALGGAVPLFGLMLACFALAGALIALVGPLLSISLLSIIPARMRPQAQALAGIFMAIGGLVGALLLGGIQTQYGVVGTMVGVAIPGVLAGVMIASAARLVEADLDRMVDDVLEEEEIRHLRDTGRPLPMLACRGIDFHYGQLQVLYRVDFTVDDGEMVALLGVNGAGKSTLLKAVSGIGLPSRGTIRYRGQEITYVDAERRVGLGITQVPGGRAVFGPMTVIENLRCYGYSLRRNRASVEAAIGHSFEAFPRLYQRRNTPASSLSGGEQQMLGLSKALMLKPRLLLIDELSLGLAPVVVGQLLAMVRQINRAGTAVVLVEQSVNIALNLVEHAYFMEKGQIRFDGAAGDLLERGDLLRAVFLQGAAAVAR